MRDALAVARLELREWRAMPLLALGAGLLTALVIGMSAPADLKNLSQVVVSACWPVAALVAGAAIFTRDLRERRASFLCARAIPMRSVWAGKMLAALVVAGGVWVLTSVPVWLVAPLPQLPVPTGVDVKGVVVFTLLFVGVGHWIALASAARGRRLVADVVLSVLLLGAVAVLSMWLWFAGALGWGTGTVIECCCVALTVAGAVAVVRGRGRRSASYAAFTTAHWVGLGVVALVEAGSLHFLRSVRPGDLDRPWVQSVSPGGDWIVLFGEAGWPRRKASPTLLVSVAGPNVVNPGRGAFWEQPGAELEFSEDGRWCAWPVLEWIAGLGSQPVMRMVELKPGAPVRSRRTPVDDAPSADTVPGILLSPSGRGLLLLHPNGRVEAVAGEDLRTLWTRKAVDGAGFLDDDNVWVGRHEPHGRELVVVGLITGEVRRTIALGGEEPSRLVVAPGGKAALALTGHPAGSWLVERCDLVSGGCKPIWEGLDKADTSAAAEGAFLADGTAVVVGRALGAASWEVRAFDAEGRSRWTLAVSSSRRAPVLVGEPRPGTLLIQPNLSERETKDVGWGFPLLVADVDEGKVLRAETLLLPSRLERQWVSPFRRGAAATYFGDSDGAVVRLDPDSGRREPVRLH